MRGIDSCMKILVWSRVKKDIKKINIKEVKISSLIMLLPKLQPITT